MLSKQYRRQKDIKGQRFTFVSKLSTKVGDIDLLHKATYLGLYRGSDSPGLLLISNLEKIGPKGPSKAKVFDMPQSSEPFYMYDGYVIANLFRVRLKEINGIPLKRIFGLDLNKWPLWALKGYFLSPIMECVGSVVRLSPEGRKIRLSGRCGRNEFLHIIKRYRQAPLKIVRAATRGNRYKTKPVFAPKKESDELTKSLLGEMFKL